MNLVTFIVPTLGRPTLRRALDSIISQTDPDWNVAVISDGVDGIALPDHPRIFAFAIPKNLRCWEYGGTVRNVGFGFDASEWFAFLDDDDRLDEHYVEWIRREGADADAVVFRMRFPDGGIAPPPHHTTAKQLEHGATGIAFAVRSRFQKSRNIQFIVDRSEDWYFVEGCIKARARVKVSEHVGYFIRH